MKRIMLIAAILLAGWIPASMPMTASADTTVREAEYRRHHRHHRRHHVDRGYRYRHYHRPFLYGYRVRPPYRYHHYGFVRPYYHPYAYPYYYPYRYPYPYRY